MQRGVYGRAAIFAVLLGGAVAAFFALGRLLEAAPWELRLILAVAAIVAFVTWAGRREE